jgi:hypothetical protein
VIPLDERLADYIVELRAVAESNGRRGRLTAAIVRNRVAAELEALLTAWRWDADEAA